MEVSSASQPSEASNNAEYVNSVANAGDSRDITPGGKLRVWSKWFGCSHNQSDWEVLLGVLEDAGYDIIDGDDEALLTGADVALIVGCTVKGPSEAHFYSLVHKCYKEQKICLLAGCVTQQAANRDSLPADLQRMIEEGRAAIIGVQELSQAATVLRNIVSGLSTCVEAPLRSLTLTAQDRWPDLKLPHHRGNPYVQILPIATGCQGHCSYCQSVFARGRLHSYPAEEITDFLTHMFATRPETRQLWLVGEDVAAWGADIGKSLPDLMDQILPLVPATCKVRIGMSNPVARYYTAGGLMERWVQVYRHPRMFKFAHIPVQSGSDAVLGAMHRGYLVSDFETIIGRLREGLAQVGERLTVATDIICGFCGETDENHRETLELLQRQRFEIVNITKFYPRPGTEAYSLPRVPTHIQKQRSREATNVVMAIDDLYDYLVGQTVEVALTEVSQKGNRLAGRTDSYVQVLCSDESQASRLLGKFVRVHITSCSRHCAEGQIVGEPSDAPTM